MTELEREFTNGPQATAWSGDEFECVPLKHRLKLLLANYRMSVSETRCSPTSPWFATLDDAVAVKDENGQCESQAGCSGEKQMEESHPGEPCKSDNSKKLANKCGGSNPTVSTAAATFEEVHSHGESFRFQDPVSVKVELLGNHVESPSVSCMSGSSPAAFQAAIDIKSQTNLEYLEDLEHVVLKERLWRLLTSRCSGFTPTVLEICSGAGRETKQFGDSKHVFNSSSKRHQGKRSVRAESLKLQNDTKKEIFRSDSKKTGLSTDVKTVENSAVSTLTNIKTEPPSYCDFLSMSVDAPEQMAYDDFLLVKSEVKITDCACEDELDNMLLHDRMKLFSPRDGPSSVIQQGLKCTSKTGSSAFILKPVVPTPSRSVKVNLPRKRRKTVADSIETAMEEDAPGLLKVLIDKGVSVDEIKLYGEPESNDALEDSSTEENFSDLEEIMAKLFAQSQHESLLKLGPMRGAKGERAGYCLECLLSLVEQARYLRFRNWPVEWGWCRDLQSFIFVFERHNRLVLERPEYGYATYFFELVELFPIQWQIKRLIVAMKLTSCSRITIIENKALMVGDDISEGEAGVLMGYGWTPNTGLGTMLNYFDRVVHDRRNERDRSEWRSKIGKLLAEGLNGGTITSAAVISESDHVVEIKMELD